MDETSTLVLENYTMTDAIPSFPVTSPPDGNSRPVLVQLKLDRDFVNAVDTGHVLHRYRERRL
jgi:hypothetical protein